MARWRANFIQWQTKAESVNQAIANPPPLGTIPTFTNAPAASVAYR